jgi:chloride channel 7
MFIVVLIGKIVGDYFNISIYDIHIELKNIPFVETTPPMYARDKNAGEIMAKPVITFRAQEKFATIYSTLQSCKHNCFPVVDE